MSYAIFLTLGIRLVKTSSAWNIALICDRNNETPSQSWARTVSFPASSFMEFHVVQFETDEARLISSCFSYLV